jgi:hypothetical protein
MIDLSTLPSLPPEPGVSDRIRRRCHASLLGERRQVTHGGDGWLFAAAAAYLIAAIHQALLLLS